MNSEQGFIHLIGTIFTVAAAVAILALVISKNSNTASVIQSFFAGNGNLLATAMSPVTGASVTVSNSYPSTSAS
jgi:hypothetical protein